jgi:Domain of unknown function (DUF1735)
MKKYIKSIKVLAFGLAVLAAACVPEGKDMLEGVGSNFVRLPAATEELNLIAVDLVAGQKSVEFLEVIRDVNSKSELLNQASVSLKVDDTPITAYNKVHGTKLELLPAALYKLSEMEVQLASGEFAKNVIITFDPTKLDATKTYAIAMTITGAGNYKVRSGLQSALFQIIAKNKYDGVYNVEGSMRDFANPALTGNYPNEMELATDGALRVILRDRALGDTNPFHSILNAGSVSYYGAFGLVINFNADNTVANVVNFHGQPAANTRSAELDPSGVNKWDPATNTLKIKYWMNQPSVITPHRTSFDETFVFKKKR